MGKTYRIRTMKMHRIVHGSIVDKANHRLAAALNDKSRPRRDAIVSNQRGGALVGIHLLGELVDVHLVVVNGLVSHGVGDGPLYVSRG